MFNRNLNRCALALLVSLMAWGAGPARAQAYPNRVVHLVVTYPPGGASDLMARVLAERLGTLWKQSIVVDNRPGAGGSMGTDFAARQPADGYTFLVGNMGPSLLNPLLSKVNYDMGKDFTPISLIATGPLVLVVNSASPYKTVQDLVAAERAKPGSLNFGSSGPGSLAQLAGEMLNHAANLHMQHVPYKGGISAINDVLASHLDMVAADPQTVMQHIKGGQLRALAVTSPQRMPSLPQVPTFAENGVPEMIALNSWGVYLPAATPKSVVTAFDAGLSKVMKDPELVKRYIDLGVEPANTSGEELRSFNAGETAKYAKIIKEKNIRLD